METDLEEFKHQVAGSHATRSQFMCGQYGRVLKPYKLCRTFASGVGHGHPPPDGTAANRALRAVTAREDYTNHAMVCETELQFYELVTSSGDLAALRQLLPGYHGEQLVNIDGTPTPHLVLDDLTRGCRFPNVTDLKMGSTRDYPGKDPAKLGADKYPSINDLCWCISGLQQHSSEGALITSFGPQLGRTLTTPQVQHYLSAFLHGNDPTNTELVTRVLFELRNINSWFKKQSLFWFRSSSILMVYSAEHLHKCQDSTEPLKTAKGRVDEKVLCNLGGEGKDNLDSVVNTEENTIRSVTDSSTTDGTKIDKMVSTNEREPRMVNTKSAATSSNTEVQLRSDSSTSKLIVRVKMIDVAHVIHANGKPDAGYIAGLENIIGFLDSFIKM